MRAAAPGGELPAGYTAHADPAGHMMSMSTSDTPQPITGLRIWSERDDEPGADVLGVVDNQCRFWEHRDGEHPWWGGYSVTWRYLRRLGPLREVKSYAPLGPGEQDDEPGADVLGVVDDTHWLWEHRGGELPWWCGYGVTWEDLHPRGPFLEVGSYVPHPWDGEPDCDTDEERAAAQEDPGGKFDAWLDAR